MNTGKRGGFGQFLDRLKPLARVSLGLWMTLLVQCQADAQSVDLELAPVVQSVPLNSVGNEFEIDILASASGSSAQPFVVVDAIIDWDPTFLEFLGVDDGSACCSWFFSGFLNDADGINLDLSDGRVLYSALSEAGSPATALAPIVVTTLRFRALAVTPSTVISFEPAMGSFGLTRVLYLPGEDHTGDISGTATVAIVDPGFTRGDANSDGLLRIEDPIFILNYLFLSSQTPGCLDSVDANDDGVVGLPDPLTVLNYMFQGGPPPPIPFFSCGPDPTFDALGCVIFPACP